MFLNSNSVTDGAQSDQCLRNNYEVQKEITMQLQSIFLANSKDLCRESFSSEKKNPATYVQQSYGETSACFLKILMSIKMKKKQMQLRPP